MITFFAVVSDCQTRKERECKPESKQVCSMVLARQELTSQQKKCSRKCVVCKNIRVDGIMSRRECREQPRSACRNISDKDCKEDRQIQKLSYVPECKNVNVEKCEDVEVETCFNKTEKVCKFVDKEITGTTKKTKCSTTIERQCKNVVHAEYKTVPRPMTRYRRSQKCRNVCAPKTGTPKCEEKLQKVCKSAQKDLVRHQAVRPY